MTTTLAGLSLEELASRRGLTVAETRELVRPFLEAGIVEQDDEGHLELVDRGVAFAIGSGAPPA